MAARAVTKLVLWSWAVLAVSASSALAQTATQQASDATTVQTSGGVALTTSSSDVQTATSDAASEQKAAQQATCGSGSLALSSGGCTKAWRVIGYAEYRQLAVTDEYARNDRALRFWLQGNYRLLKKHNLQAWARVRYLQNFVADPGERAARLQDTLLGLDYMHSLNLEEIAGWKSARLTFQHRATGAIPHSRESRNDDLHTRLSALERIRLMPIPDLYVGIDSVFEYGFYKYAEQAGPQGTALPQAATQSTLVVEYFPFHHDKWGSILIGVDGGLGWTLLHRARGGETPDGEDPNRWRQDYAWDAYAYYLPLNWLWLGVAVSHSMNVLRDGVVNPDFVNRDATLLMASVTALY